MQPQPDTLQPVGLDPGLGKNNPTTARAAPADAAADPNRSGCSFGNRVAFVAIFPTCGAAE